MLQQVKHDCMISSAYPLLESARNLEVFAILERAETVSVLNTRLGWQNP